MVIYIRYIYCTSIVAMHKFVYSYMVMAILLTVLWLLYIDCVRHMQICFAVQRFIDYIIVQVWNVVYQVAKFLTLARIVHGVQLKYMNIMC